MSTKQYPVSTNGRQCIGPCYARGINIIHPNTLDDYAFDDGNYCPVDVYLDTDKETGKTDPWYFDKCIIPTVKDMKEANKERHELVIPEMQFSSEYFTKLYYGLRNINDLIEWLDKNVDAPYNTKKRVFDHGMVVYGDAFTIIDQRFVKYVSDIMIHNADKIFDKMKKYIGLVNGTMTLLNPEVSANDNHLIDDDKKRKYLMEKLITPENVHEFVAKYMRYYKAEMTDRGLADRLVDRMIEYVIKKIELTLKRPRKMK